MGRHHQETRFLGQEWVFESFIGRIRARAREGAKLKFCESIKKAGLREKGINILGLRNAVSLESVGFGHCYSVFDKGLHALALRICLTFHGLWW